MSATTAWVKKPYHTKGLDPLGVQAPCINLYGQLLPGITNVTDRARYYSFYPWVVWAFEQLPGSKPNNDLVEWVRRADCLFTMIGIRHRIMSGDSDFLKHDAALAGSQTLRSVVAGLTPGNPVHLSTYTVREDNNPLRYFKSPFGGLGQYYIGTFDSLGLMKSVEHSVRYTREGGKPLAEALDTVVDRRLFTEVVQSDEVTTERLDGLANFCGCQLLNSPQEHDILVDLFFDTASQRGDKGKQRRRSLGLLLDLARSLPKEGKTGRAVLDHHVFRGCVYSGFLPDGRIWELPSSAAKVRSGWAVYQRNELLSVAAQCFFWVALRCIEDEKPELATTDDFVRWFATSRCVSETAATFEAQKFDTVLKVSSSGLARLADWHSESHEVATALRALELLKNDNSARVGDNLLGLAARILLGLVARDDKAKPAYEPMGFPAEYFNLYPVNLQSLREVASTVWPGMAVADWLAWVAGHWGIEAHLRVALRKLRNQSQDTFHVLPTDRGYVVKEMPDPTYTTPRFEQAVQILQDLGMIERPPGGNWEMSLTPLGEKLWRVSLD